MDLDLDLVQGLDLGLDLDLDLVQDLDLDLVQGLVQGLGQRSVRGGSGSPGVEQDRLLPAQPCPWTTGSGPGLCSVPGLRFVLIRQNQDPEQKKVLWKHQSPPDNVQSAERKAFHGKFISTLRVNHLWT